ncbi:MAG: hypothetical protein WC889_12005, partial [Myxococcota bacterium]
HFVLPHYFTTTGSWLLAGELQATALEALAYWLLGKPRDLPRALIASAMANSLSYGVGVLLGG